MYLVSDLVSGILGGRWRCNVKGREDVGTVSTKVETEGLGETRVEKG